MYVLMRLPESYNILVTALESGSDTVPAMENVTECLLREEQKIRDWEEASNSKEAPLI